MSFQLELPDIGEGVVEAEVQRWFVAPGDEVQEDQPLVEVMTDKATIVIPSPRRGRVVRLFWKEGETAKVHRPLVELETAGAEAAQPEATRGEPPRAARGPAPAGAAVEQAPAAQADRPPAPKKALATPAVRALAREMGIAIEGVSGTGPGGRVTKEDLAAARGRGNGKPPFDFGPGSGPYAQGERPAAFERDHGGAQPSPVRAPPGRTKPGDAAAPVLVRGREGEDERIPLRGLRKRIAENMARSKRTAAHFTFVEQCDVSELVRVKEQIAAAARDEGAKVTFLPFIVKAAVAALRKHPRLNATMDEDRGELVIHHRYDIGIASATEAGLVVPVVRNADRLSLLDLAREIERLSSASKTGRIRPEDLGRSTFTVTSLGALGGLFATPILNTPEVAILGIHRIRATPVARGGEVVVRDVMHVSVTSDHRVVDGQEAAAFAYDLIRQLESPYLMFMQMA